MKVIYEFCPEEDREALETFQDASKNASLIHDFKQHFKRIMKHTDMSEEKYAAYEDMINFLEGE